ncbi:MAG: MFS transporter [Deltaproteobacteria bacterium]|nr:MFS transporter [Deltaproteobacteria bacterium]
MAVLDLSERKLNLKILLVLSFGHLVTDIYQGALPAILPFLKTRLSLSYAMAGVILMAASFTSSIMQPLFGYLSDQKEKLILLPLGCLAAGLGLALLPAPSRYGGILMLVMVSGLGVAAYHPEGYKTAHYFTGKNLATGMSVFSVGGNLGFALGPVIALTIVTRLGFEALPVIIIFSLLFLCFFLVHRTSISIAKPGRSAALIPAGATGRNAYLPLCLTIGAVVMRSWTQLGLMTYIPFYYIDYLKGDPMYSGKLISTFLLGGVVGTIFGSILADRWGHKLLLLISMFTTSLLVPLILVVRGPALFAVLAVIGLALISSFTVTIVMAQKLLPQNLGIASGLMVGFAIGVGGLGVTLIGLLADHFGIPMALKSIIILPIIGLGLSWMIRYPS